MNKIPKELKLLWNIQYKPRLNFIIKALKKTKDFDTIEKIKKMSYTEHMQHIDNLQRQGVFKYE